MNYLLQRLLISLLILRFFTVDFFINAGYGDSALCVICFENLDAVDAVNTKLKCGHIFHSLCINKWFEVKKYKSCPLCMKFDSSQDGVDPLIDACKALNYLDILKNYIAMGADVNGQNNAGITPLHAACLIVENRDRFRAIDCLLNAGACNFEIKNSNGFTALMLLAFTNKIDSILQIIAYCLSKKHDLRYCLSGEQLQSIALLVPRRNKDFISGRTAEYKQIWRNYYK